MADIFQRFCTGKINSTKLITINIAAQWDTAVSCASHRFRKRKEPGNALMMNVEIPNAHLAVQDAPLMSNLYL